MPDFDGNALYPAVVRLQGEHTVWDDLDFAMTIRTVAGEGPTLVNLNGTGIYAYAFGNGKAAYFQRQIPHAFKAAQSGWKPHVHWLPTTTGTYTGSFTLDYVTHQPGNDSPLSSKSTIVGSFSRAAAAFQSVVTGLPTIDGSAWAISTLIFAKLTITLTAGASIILSGMDWHGEIDSLGSELEDTKL